MKSRITKEIEDLAGDLVNRTRQQRYINKKEMSQPGFEPRA